MSEYLFYLTPCTYKIELSFKREGPNHTLARQCLTLAKLATLGFAGAYGILS